MHHFSSGEIANGRNVGNNDISLGDGQFFVDNKFIGGAADACIMWKKGELQTLFQDAGIEFSDDYDGDPFEFLPKWMTKNPLRSR